MNELFSAHFDFSAPSYLANYFLVNESKQRLITKMHIQLADGYEFVELDPDVSSYLFYRMNLFGFFFRDKARISTFCLVDLLFTECSCISARKMHLMLNICYVCLHVYVISFDNKEGKITRRNCFQL